MASIIGKIRARSRSKSVERNSGDDSDRRRNLSFSFQDSKDKEALQNSSLSSADSGVSSIYETPTSPDENALSDEQDIIGGEISGTLALAFTENASSPTLSFNKDFDYNLPWDGSHSKVISVTFEVISAEVIKDGRSSHVNYTVLINPSKDGCKGAQTVIIRRYSDFEYLHQMLRKKFPSVMSHVSFPRKVLMGNFTSQTIAKRSTAFEQYLSHLYSYFEVRYSHEYMEFFVEDNFYCAIKHFMEKEYSRAVPFFEKTIPVLEKLYGHFHPRVVQCVCCLVVCFKQLELPNAAHSCSEMMLKCCIPENSSADDELRCAVLITAINLYWTVGKDKVALEKKLEEMHEKGYNVKGARDLKQILCRTFDMNTV